MARKIARIAAGIAMILGMLGLATASLAQPKKPKKPPVMQLPPKSCTWVAAEAKDTEVVASGGTHTEKNGTMWKCSNGSWSRVRTPPTKGVPKT
jgi:hypothetical protein